MTGTQENHSLQSVQKRLTRILSLCEGLAEGLLERLEEDSAAFSAQKEGAAQLLKLMQLLEKISEMSAQMQRLRGNDRVKPNYALLKKYLEKHDNDNE